VDTVCSLLPVSECSWLDLSPKLVPVRDGERAAAAHHHVSTNPMQVIDFIDGSSLLRKWASNRVVNDIKHLASLWAGFPQSYPQLEWKQGKSPKNHDLGGLLSRGLELCRLS
jgi:hypothetical protein